MPHPTPLAALQHLSRAVLLTGAAVAGVYAIVAAGHLLDAPSGIDLLVVVGAPLAVVGLVRRAVG